MLNLASTSSLYESSISSSQNSGDLTILDECGSSFCCNLGNKSGVISDSQNITYNYFNDTLTFIQVILFIIMAIKLQRNYSKLESEANLRINSNIINETENTRNLNRKGAVLTFYYTYSVIAIIWAFTSVLAMFMPDESSLFVLPHVIYEVHGFLDNCIIILAFFNKHSKFAIGFSMIFSIIIALIEIILTIIFHVKFLCKTCSLFFPGPVEIYVYVIKTVIYGIILVLTFINFKFKPRKTIRLWLIMLITINVIGIIGTPFLLFDIDFGFCIIDFDILLYSFVYVPLLYYTFIKDSIYIREIEILDLDERYPLNGGLFSVQEMAFHLEDDNFSDNEHIIEAKDLLKDFPDLTWIDFKQIKVGKRLGAGGMGEVRYGLYRGTPVALKRMFRQEEKALQDFYVEVKAMSKLSHPHVVLFMGVSVDDKGDHYIITEFMDWGSVFDIIHAKQYDSKKEITPKRIKSILLQSALGMAYLHGFATPILHRDFKSQNLLIDHDWNVKVADFGLSRPKGLQTMTATGTPQWSAPEVIRRERYSEKADVYSFGMVIYELLSKQVPYKGMTAIAAAHAVAFKGLRPQFPSNADPDYVQLAEECLEEDPNERPVFSEIVNILKSLAPPKIVIDNNDLILLE